MKLYLHYFSIHIKSVLQYKTSAIMMFMGQFITSFTALLSVYFMMSRFYSVKSFTLEEVFLCFGCVQLAFSLTECFARGFDDFSSMISNGEFDRIMLRPKGLVFQVLSSKVEFSRLGRTLQAVLVFIYALIVADISWNPYKVFTLVFMVIGGISVFFGLFLINAALTFFTIEGLEVMHIFTDGSREFAQYPVSIYGKAILRFLTFVVPVALFQYYPLLVLTGKSDSVLYMLAPVISGLFLIPSVLIWRFGVKHYKSTGS